MSYTPRRVLAWKEVHERVRGARAADLIDAIAIGNHAGRKRDGIVKKMRENL